MNTQLKAKMEVAILSATINGMKNYKGEITYQELLRRKDELVDTLYTEIAMAEPKREEDVV